MEKKNQTKNNLFKVNDRRKFNVDGSLREGVELEPEKPKEEAKTEAAEAESASETAPSATDAAEFENLEEGESMTTKDIRARTTRQVLSIFSRRWRPSRRRARRDAASGDRTAHVWIWKPANIGLTFWQCSKKKPKTICIRKKRELFEGILGDLRMQYVQIMRVTEEKLKQQAAQKFSASDILGKK